MNRVLEIEGNSNNETFDLLEGAIRKRESEVIESLYEYELQQFVKEC